MIQAFSRAHCRVASLCTHPEAFQDLKGNSLRRHHNHEVIIFMTYLVSNLFLETIERREQFFG